MVRDHVRLVRRERVGVPRDDVQVRRRRQGGGGRQGGRAIEAQKAAEDAVKAAASEMTGAPAAATSPAPVAVAPVAVSPAPVAQQQAQAAAPASEEDDKDEDDKDEPAGSPEPPASKTCTAIIDTASDEWCTTTCATSYCPPTACKCDE